MLLHKRIRSVAQRGSSADRLLDVYFAVQST
jgi:hypothetical protein